VVHISAGFAALVASAIVGKRFRVSAEQGHAHNVPFVLLGAALLSFGWYGSLIPVL
jgi:Amt family ammonium transporter